jgi:hypothetical protein
VSEIALPVLIDARLAACDEPADDVAGGAGRAVQVSTTVLPEPPHQAAGCCR